VRRPLSGQTQVLFWRIREGPSFEQEFDLSDEIHECRQMLEDACCKFGPGEYLDDDDYLLDLEPAKRSAVEEIRKEIFKRRAEGKPVTDLSIIGEVYYFWLKHQCCPTVKQLAEWKRISRSKCYRLGYTSKAIRRAYSAACEAS